MAVDISVDLAEYFIHIDPDLPHFLLGLN